MKIVFDMDNTLFDELGKEPRDGMEELVRRLLDRGHELALWTSSTRARARMILREHGFEKYFAEFVFREDYDPDNKGRGKDIRKIGGDVLIDDDPKQIRFMKKIKRRGIRITAYRGGPDPDPDEIERIYKELNRRRLFALFRR